MQCTNISLEKIMVVAAGSRIDAGVCWRGDTMSYTCKKKSTWPEIASAWTL